MREVHPRLKPNPIPVRIPFEKDPGMPNVHKSYDIQIKTRKKNADPVNLDNLR
jgi:hypothetical protein